MITVACVWVRGNVPYTAEYVVNLRAMVARHLSMPHRFICLTDRPHLPRGIESFPIASRHRDRGWWAKMELFSPAFEQILDGRALYLDLDTLVVGALDPIADYPSTFALAPPGGQFKSARYETVYRFNSSVMVWTPGEESRALWRAFTPAASERYWGDQDLIGATLPGAASMPFGWFPRLSELGKKRPGPEARVVLVKKPKNHVAVEQFPWIAETWRVA